MHKKRDKIGGRALKTRPCTYVYRGSAEACVIWCNRYVEREIDNNATSEIWKEEEFSRSKFMSSRLLCKHSGDIGGKGVRVYS